MFLRNYGNAKVPASTLLPGRPVILAQTTKRNAQDKHKILANIEFEIYGMNFRRLSTRPTGIYDVTYAMGEG